MNEQNEIEIPRRDFLVSTAFAAGGAALLRPAEMRAERKKAGGFRLGTVTYNLAREWDLDTLIDHCEATGFEGVELRSTHAHGVEPHLTGPERESVRRRFEETTVDLVCLGTACEYHAIDQEELEGNIRETIEFLRLARDVGAKAIKVRPNGLPEERSTEATLRQIGNSLSRCAEAADEFDVEIWVEVHGRGTSHPPHIRRIMDLADSAKVGVTWNCNPSDLKDGQLRPYYELLEPDIRNVHLHDLVSDYPYRELFRYLSDSGFQGYTLAEIPEVQGDPVRFMKYYRALWSALQ